MRSSCASRAACAIRYLIALDRAYTEQDSSPIQNWVTSSEMLLGKEPQSPSAFP